MTKRTKTEKEFDTVQFFREVKSKIAKETANMTFAELKAFINKRQLRLSRCFHLDTSGQ
jgi:hypothetical protein